MPSEFDTSEQLNSRPTRRVVVATGAKLAYTVPIVAASFKVSTLSASAAVTGDFCGHSVGTNGGCMPACTNNGRFTGTQCGVICGTGQNTGACPVRQGGDNPCCNAGYCDPANFVAGPNGTVRYTGPTTGCPSATSPPPTSSNSTLPVPSPPKKQGKASKKKQGKAKKRR
jgi:hypothetical protein